MFAFFNIGVQEMIVLGVLGFVVIGVPIIIVLAVVLSKKNRDY